MPAESIIRFRRDNNTSRHGTSNQNQTNFSQPTSYAHIAAKKTYETCQTEQFYDETISVENPETTDWLDYNDENEICEVKKIS